MNNDIHLIIIRHGQTQANVDHKWHGSTDTALNETGGLQAQKAAERIAREHSDVSAIYASPLQRTLHTAQRIAELLDIEVITEPRIQEYGIGTLEGTSFDELREQHDFFDRVAADPHYAPELGESIHGVGTRVISAFEDFTARHPGEKVVAVSHGAAMALALAGIFHDDWYQWHRFHFQNTAVTELNLGSVPKLLRFNCVEHLTAAGLDNLPTVTNG